MAITMIIRVINATVCLLLVSVLTGCAGSPYAMNRLNNALDKVRSENRTNLLRLELGMSKTQVFEVMGTGERKLWGGIGNSTRIANPYKTEIFDAGNGPVEVLYYYTDLQQQDGAITDDELTPLILKESKLVGWGRSYFDQSVDKKEIRIR